MDASKAERVLREIESSSGGRWLPIIGRRRGQILVEQIRLHRPRRILEVGTFVGYSTPTSGILQLPALRAHMNIMRANDTIHF